MTDDDYKAEAEESSGWLCSCGAWMDHDFHCDDCGAEPPWGCDCCQDAADEEDDYDGEDAWDYDWERP